LNLVLPKDALSTESRTQISTHSDLAGDNTPTLSPPSVRDDSQLCAICSLPFSDSETAARPKPLDPSDSRIAPKSRPHEASLAHQVCLAHSHPPSHLDRTRKGLAYLSTYGWDPDSRLGLGSEGQGIQFPIKTKAKDDKLGIGVVLPKPGEMKRKEKVVKLDAGKVRKVQERDKRKRERLQEMFYRSEDVERYLGGG
jgi:hypothetical protein